MACVHLSQVSLLSHSHTSLSGARADGARLGLTHVWQQ